MNTHTKEQIKNDLYQYVQKVGSQNAASKRLTNVSNATISNILADKWDNISDQMWSSIKAQVSTNVLTGGWLIMRDTKFMSDLARVYDDAKVSGEAFCVIAPAGAGKTEMARQYCEGANAYLVKCKEYLNRKTFLAELLRAMGKDADGYTVYEMMAVVIREILRAESPIIILDEADKLSDQVLYFFITIYNETEGKCGLVLQATSHLKKRIEKGIALNKKGYNEIYSRIGRKFIEPKQNRVDELKDIIRLNGVDDELDVVRIVNDSDNDIRRIKRLVLAYKRKKGVA